MMEKMRFSAKAFIKTWFESPACWIREIDGKEVIFAEQKGIAQCGNYFVIKEWCEPINDSDNNDK